MRSKYPAYVPLPFHAVRAISGLSAVIVASILGFFCQQLYKDGFKIPWTFIIVLLAAIFSLVAMILTSIISCCGHLSPIFNILINLPLFLLWLVGLSLLTWNMYGALGHTCSIANWGNDRGVMVCQIYKALYTFIIFANLAQIAQIVLDVRARRHQKRDGRYDNLGDDRDVKTDDLKPLTANNIHDTPLASETSLHQQYRDRDDQHQQPQHFVDETPGWRPGLNQNQSYASTTSNYSSRHDDNYYGYEGSNSVQMQDFSSHHRQQQTHYDSRDYHSGDIGYGHQQNSYHQGRY